MHSCTCVKGWEALMRAHMHSCACAKGVLTQVCAHSNACTKGQGHSGVLRWACTDAQRAGELSQAVHVHLRTCTKGLCRGMRDLSQWPSPAQAMDWCQVADRGLGNPALECKRQDSSPLGTLAKAEWTCNPTVTEESYSDPYTA